MQVSLRGASSCTWHGLALIGADIRTKAVTALTEIPQFCRATLGKFAERRQQHGPDADHRSTAACGRCEYSDTG